MAEPISPMPGASSDSLSQCVVCLVACLAPDESVCVGVHLYLQASTCWSALLCWCHLLVMLRAASRWACQHRAAASWGAGRHRSSHNTLQGGPKTCSLHTLFTLPV
jgi:hypothetical protein